MGSEKKLILREKMEELVKFHCQDLHAGFVNEQQQQQDQDQMDETQIWNQHHHHHHHQNFLSDNDEDTLMFYSDFPPLPDFPCMSSSSSSSSTPVPLKPTGSPSLASSPSSATSWAVLKSEADETAEEIRTIEKKSSAVAAAAMSSPPAPQTGLHGGDCTEDMMMETLGYMDLLEDSNDFFDPSCIFQNEQQQQREEEDPLEDLQLESFEEVEMEDLMMMHGGENNDNIKRNDVVEEEGDLAKVFLEWLRSNRETVSADDLRNVRIKKATIESAARRLGGGKEGMKQLLKLVLEWVQTNHLHKRKFKEVVESDLITNTTTTSHLLGFQNPNNSTPWIQTPPPPPLYSPPVLGYGDAYSGGFPDRYPLLDSTLSWTNSNSNSNNLSTAATQFGLASSHFNAFVENFAAVPPPQPQGFVAGYGGGHQYPYVSQYFQGPPSGGAGGGGENGLVRLDSMATKEARKKRMARQRRFSTHHRHHHGGHHGSHHHHGNSHQNQHPTQMNTNASDHCTLATTAQPNGAGNWVYWPSPTGAGASSTTSSGYPVESPPLHAADRPNSSMQIQNYPPRIPAERRQVGFLVKLQV